MKKKLWIGLGLIAALLIGYGTAYAQGISIQFLGPWNGQNYGEHGVYRIYDGPNLCYVAKGVESISIFCMKK